MNESGLVTAEQLAKELAVRPETIKRWHRVGRIPCVRISKTVVRYDLAEVLKNLKEHGKPLPP